MEALLAWLEASTLGATLRGAGVWTYGLLNLGHILGVATLFGAVLILDLRLLGAWRSIPLSALARPAVPLAATGFGVAATTGLLMLSFNATDYLGNPFLYVKLPVIGLALVNVVVVQRLPAWRRGLLGAELSGAEGRTLAVAGGLSLLLWLIVLGCGRMIGYW